MSPSDRGLSGIRRAHLGRPWMWKPCLAAFDFLVFVWACEGPRGSRGRLRQPRHFAMLGLVRSCACQTALRLLFAGTGSNACFRMSSTFSSHMKSSFERAASGMSSKSCLFRAVSRTREIPAVAAAATFSRIPQQEGRGHEARFPRHGGITAKLAVE